METVIQKYLRNEYETIEEYNAQAGEVAEPFRVLVVANFPANFTLEAARRLVSIVNSGPSCGVYTLITRDPKQPLPQGFNLADLEQGSINLTWKDGAFVWKDADFCQVPAGAGSAAGAGRGDAAGAAGRRAEQGREPGRGAVRLRGPAAGRDLDGRRPRRAVRRDRPGRGDQAADVRSWARGRRSTRWSPARPGRASRRCCTPSSRTWR